MADRIGCQRSWFQHNGSMPHYDLSLQRRKRAIELGAIEIDRRQVVELLRKHRLAGNKLPAEIVIIHGPFRGHASGVWEIDEHLRKLWIDRRVFPKQMRMNEKTFDTLVLVSNAPRPHEGCYIGYMNKYALSLIGAGYVRIVFDDTTPDDAIILFDFENIQG